jgi:hypothetical protein
MAFRVDFTEIAVEDLESISNFIADDNPALPRVCVAAFTIWRFRWLAIRLRAEYVRNTKIQTFAI